MKSVGNVSDKFNSLVLAYQAAGDFTAVDPTYVFDVEAMIIVSATAAGKIVGYLDENPSRL